MSSEAFKIRGHHLGRFAQLTTGEYAPEALAERLADKYRFLDADYEADVLGDSPSGPAIFRERLAVVFRQFAELSPDDPITITNGERDGICQSCVVGKHCVDLGEEYAVMVDDRPLRVYASQLGGDMHFIGKFVDLSQTLEKEGILKPHQGKLQNHNENVEALIAPDLPLIEETNIGYQFPITAGANYTKTVLSHWQDRYPFLI